MKLFNRLKNGFFAYFICFTEYRALILFTLLRAAVIALCGALFWHEYFIGKFVAKTIRFLESLVTMSSAQANPISDIIGNVFGAMILGIISIAAFKLACNYFIGMSTAHYMQAHFQTRKPSVLNSLVSAFTQLRAWLFLLFTAAVIVAITTAAGIFIASHEIREPLSTFLIALPSIIFTILFFFVSAVIGTQQLSFVQTLKASFRCLCTYWVETVGFCAGGGLLVGLLTSALLYVLPQTDITITRLALMMVMPPETALTIVRLAVLTILMVAKDIFKAAVVCAANNQPCGPFEKYLALHHTK